MQLPGNKGAESVTAPWLIGTYIWDGVHRLQMWIQVECTSNTSQPHGETVGLNLQPKTELMPTCG